MAKRTIKATAPKRKAAERVQTVSSRSATVLSAKRALAKAGREAARDSLAWSKKVGSYPGCAPYPEWKAQVMPSENYWVALERVPARVRPVARRLVRNDASGLLEEKYYLEPIDETLYAAWKKGCKR
jgi:hypothetical protein